MKKVLSKISFNLHIKCFITVVSLAVFFGFFIACDNNNNSVIENKKYTIRYEANCANPSLYKIKVSYSVGQVKTSTDTENMKTEIIESPFSFEIKMKTGMVAALNVSPVYKFDNDPRENRIVTGKIYVDGRLEKEDHSDVAVAIAVPLLNN